MHEQKMAFQQKLLEKADFNFKLIGLAGRFRQMESALSLASSEISINFPLAE